MTVLYSTVMNLFITWPVDGQARGWTYLSSSWWSFKLFSILTIATNANKHMTQMFMSTRFSRVYMFCNRIDVSEGMRVFNFTRCWLYRCPKWLHYYHSHQLLMGVPLAPRLLHCNFCQLQCTSNFCQSDGCKKLMCTLNNRSAPFPHLFLDIQRKVWSHFSICRGPEPSWGEA